MGAFGVIVSGVTFFILFILQCYLSALPVKNENHHEQEVYLQTQEKPSSSPGFLLELPAIEEIPVDEEREDILMVQVEPGDTLWDLSEKYLGDPWKYASLARLNGIENPQCIYAGDILGIPVVHRETVRKTADWFLQEDIPVNAAGNYSMPLRTENTRTGNEYSFPDINISVDIRSLGQDPNRSEYKIIEASFVILPEQFPSGTNKIYYYCEVADRYTGVSIMQKSLLTMEYSIGAELYELPIRDTQSGQEGIVYIIVEHSGSSDSFLTIHADVPDWYDGIVFGLGEYGKYGEQDAYTLYTVQELAIHELGPDAENISWFALRE